MEKSTVQQSDGIEIVDNCIQDTLFIPNGVYSGCYDLWTILKVEVSGCADWSIILHLLDELKGRISIVYVNKEQRDRDFKELYAVISNRIEVWLLNGGVVGGYSTDAINRTAYLFEDVAEINRKRLTSDWVSFHVCKVMAEDLGNRVIYRDIVFTLNRTPSTEAIREAALEKLSDVEIEVLGLEK